MYKELGKTIDNVFTCDVNSKIVEQIILLDEIDDLWKLLLIMVLVFLQTRIIM